MAIQNPQDKKLRAMLAVQKTVLEGKTQGEAAKELGISIDTVQRDLAFARKANLYVEYEQRMWEELVPLAHEAVKLGLEDGNAELGLKILQGVNIVKTKQLRTQAEQDNEEELYGEIARLRAGAVIDVTPKLGVGDEAPEQTGAATVDVPDGIPASGVHRAEETETAEGQNRVQDAPKTIEGTIV